MQQPAHYNSMDIEALEAMFTSGSSLLRVVALALLIWSVISTMLIGGLGAWIASARHRRARR